MLRSRGQSDAKAVAAVCRGQVAAFGELVDYYLPVVRALAYSQTRNHADAEDIIQETFLRAFRSLPALRDAHRFGSWLVTIARNTGLNFLKARTREAEVLADYRPSEVVESDAAAHELRALIRTRIDDLEPPHREVLLLYYFAHKSVAEVAGLLCISRSAVKKRLQRARETLGESLLDSVGRDLALEGDLPESKTRIMMAVMACPIPQGGIVALEAVGSGAAGHTLATLGGALVLKKLVLVGVVAGVACLTWWGLRTRNEERDGQTRLTASQSLKASAPSTQPSEAMVETARSFVDEDTASPGGPLEIDVSGIVLEPSGRRAAEAKVIAFTETPETEVEAKSNAAGVFEMAGFVPASELYLRASLGQWISKLYGPIPLSDEGLDGYQIQLVVPGGARGMVVDLKGVPVQGAGIRVRPGDKSQEDLKVTAGADGAFRVLGLVPMEYAFTPEPPDAMKALGGEGVSIQVQAGVVREGLRLVLDLGGDAVISGRVLDTAGSPVSGAFVCIFNQVDWTTRSDEDGHYRLEGLSEATHAVEAYKRGYGTRTHWEVPGGSENIDFVLPQVQTTFAGQVVRADTLVPIRRFEALVLPGGSPDNLQQFRNWAFVPFEDPEGRFRIDDVEHLGYGWALYLARADGFALAHEVVRIADEGPPVEPVLRLDAQATVNGVVVDASGKPVPGSRVFIGPLRDLANLTQESAAIANADGSFALNGLSEDTEIISAYHADYPPGATTVSLKAGETTSVRIVLSEGGVLEGVVTLDGRPQADVSVSLHQPGELGGSLFDGHSDTSGRFRFTSLTPGPMEVSAFYPRAENSSSHATRRLIQPVVIARGQTTVVDLDLRTWEGVLEGTAHYDGLLPRSGHLKVFAASDEGRAFASTGLDGGAFRIEGLPPGAAQVEATAFFDNVGSVVRTKHLDIELLEGLNEITVDFAQGARLGGSVAGLRVEEEAFVDVYRGALDEVQLADNHHSDLVWQGPLRGDGTFLATGFQPGTYTIRVTISDGSAAIASERGVALAGVVVDLANDKADGWVEFSAH